MFKDLRDILHVHFKVVTLSLVIDLRWIFIDFFLNYALHHELIVSGTALSSTVIPITLAHNSKTKISTNICSLVNLNTRM